METVIADSSYSLPRRSTQSSAEDGESRCFERVRSSSNVIGLSSVTICGIAGASASGDCDAQLWYIRSGSALRKR